MTDRIPDSELKWMLHRHGMMCQDRDHEHRRDEAEVIADYVPRLVAEVRRLRALPDATSEELEVIGRLLNNSKEFGLQAEAFLSYVNFRMSGDAPADAASYAMCEWDIF